ncbi:hypothetical protein SGODD07_01953 [Streptococcus gordonii]|uniref:Uncharacterized protein n=1 Tax=Streptococcus gordonii TaxID=1302 RepID=A0A139MYS2_STRGN|nr:hypothetical protein SGODD07_01953 [Streptococcus gordonii]
MSTFLTDLSTYCGKLFEKLSVMENNWIVRERLLANGFIIFIMKMKKRKSSK